MKVRKLLRVEFSSFYCEKLGCREPGSFRGLGGESLNESSFCSGVQGINNAYIFFKKSFYSGMHPSERRWEYCNTEESSEEDCKYVLGLENKPYNIRLKNVFRYCRLISNWIALDAYWLMEKITECSELLCVVDRDIKAEKQSMYKCYLAITSNFIKMKLFKCWNNLP